MGIRTKRARIVVALRTAVGLLGAALLFAGSQCGRPANRVPVALTVFGIEFLEFWRPLSTARLRVACGAEWEGCEAVLQAPLECTVLLDATASYRKETDTLVAQLFCLTAEGYPRLIHALTGGGDAGTVTHVRILAGTTGLRVVPVERMERDLHRVVAAGGLMPPAALTF